MHSSFRLACHSCSLVCSLSFSFSSNPTRQRSPSLRSSCTFKSHSGVPARTKDIDVLTFPACLLDSSQKLSVFDGGFNRIEAPYRCFDTATEITSRLRFGLLGPSSSYRVYHRNGLFFNFNVSQVSSLLLMLWRKQLDLGRAFSSVESCLLSAIHDN